MFHRGAPQLDRRPRLDSKSQSNRLAKISGPRISTRLPEILILLPKFRPTHPRRPAHKNIRMVIALLVFHSAGNDIVAGQVASGKSFVGLLRAKTQNNQRGWRRRRITAEPPRIGYADWRRQAITRGEDLDGACFAVISDDHSGARALFDGQPIANVAHRLNQFIPADVLAQIAVAAAREVFQPPPIS